MSLSGTAGMTVDDVYKCAYDIAEEFEKIVELNGIDTVKPLVEKVIHSLELLESGIKKIELLEIELGELTSSNLHLSSVKIMNDQDNANLKQTYEEAEESWLQEVAALKSRIFSLERENKSLRNHLLVKAKAETDNSAIENQENALFRLRHSLRQKDKQLQESASNICALNDRIEELMKFNKILHIQNQEAKKDITQLAMEKYEYKSKWIILNNKNQILSESIHERVDCNSFKPKEHLDRKEVELKMKLLEKMRRLQSELQLERELSRQYKEKLSVGDKENSFPNSRIHQFFHLFLGVSSA